MEARVDFDKHAASVSRAFNLVALPEGALTFRPGTRFIKEVKTSSSATWLLPFDPVADSAYMIEAGATYLRFYKHQQRLTAAAVSATITNGTFTSNINDWDNRSTGSAAISNSSGTLKLDGDTSGTAWAEQDIAIHQQSAEHVIRFKATADHPGSTFTVQIGSATLGKTLLETKELRPGYHTIAITPGVATIYLQFLNENSDNVYIDDVEILTNAPLELTSPYAAADVSALRITQSADVMYLFHADYAPYKIERRGDRAWSIVKVFFEDGPYLDVNPDTDLTAYSLVNNGTFEGGIQDWTSTPVSTVINFDHDNNRVEFLAGSGAGYISQLISGHPKWASGKECIVHVQTIGVSDRCDVLIGSAANDSSDLNANNITTGWTSYSATPADATYITLKGTIAAAGPLGFGACYVYNTRARLLKASASAIGSITVTALDEFKPFLTTDVGRMLRLEHVGREPGWGIITAVATNQSATVWMYRKAASTVATETWQFGAWSDSTGFPKTGLLYQQRLFAANTENQPQTIWASQSQDFENMRPDSFVDTSTAQDDDALNFTLAASRVSPINWMTGSRKLILGTGTGQWAVSSKGAVLTPSDFAAEEQSSVKGADQAAVQIDTVGLFTHRSQRGIFDIGFNYEIDGFSAADVTVLARHITRGKVAQIVYQEEPFSQLWARLEDGTMACMAYKRSQNVIGWTPERIAGTGAVVESLAVIPGAAGSGQAYSSKDRDELWMIVRRTVNGATVRHIEVMEGYYEGPYRHDYLDREAYRMAVRDAQVDAVCLDSCVTYSGSSTTTITGLDHLEGETVAVVANGKQLGDEVVASGSITIDSAGTKVHVGLPYVWRYKSSKLPYGARTGSSVGLTKNIAGLNLALLDAAGFYYAVDIDRKGPTPPTLYAKTFAEEQDSASTVTPLFTGETEITQEGGFAQDPRIILSNSSLSDGSLLQEDGDDLLQEDGDTISVEGDQYLDAIALPFTLLGIGPVIDTSP